MLPAIDIVALMTAAYRILWSERFYLLRLGTFPVLVIYANFIIANLADLPPLRHGLAMFPAYVAEAWFVSQFLRTMLTRERWPITLPRGFSGPLPPQLLERARGLLSSIICYTVISLGLAALAGVLVSMMPPDLKSAPRAQDPVLSSIMLVVFIVMITQFRLFWIYIPFVVNVPLGRYLTVTKNWMTGIHMIGLWLAAALPIMALMVLILQPAIPLATGDTPGAFIVYLITGFFNVVAQTFMSLVTSVAVALAIAPALIIQKRDENAG